MMELTNKIINDDCFEVMKKLPDCCFDDTFTSPPYNRVRNDTYEYFDDINDNYCDMLIELANQCLRLTKGNVIINIQQNMCNKEDFFKWLGVFAKNIKGIVIWEKLNPQPATNYRDDGTYSVTNAFEYFVIMGKDNKEFRANHKFSNVITSYVNSEHFEGHGAVMKLSVAEKMILNFTAKNGIVFDPFMGLGTTAIACHKNHRNYFGCEISPEYYEQCMKRVNDFKKQLTFL